MPPSSTVRWCRAVAIKGRSRRDEGTRTALVAEATESLARRGIRVDDPRLLGLVDRFKTRSELDSSQLLRLLEARRELLGILSSPNPTTKMVLARFDPGQLLGALDVMAVQVQIALTQMEHSLTDAKPTVVPIVRLLDEVDEIGETAPSTEKWDHVAAVAGLVLAGLPNWQTHTGGFAGLCEVTKKYRQRREKARKVDAGSDRIA